MKSDEREPTQDELAAMAYADGELHGDAARAFETRLEREPALVRAVADELRLTLIARACAGPEPADFEWRRIARDPLQRSLGWIGWVLAAAGALGALAWVIWSFETSTLDPWIKLAFAALMAGLAILFGLTVRARLRTLPLDPYRDVQR